MELNQQWTDTAELAQPLLGKLQLNTTFRYEGPRSVNKRPLERFGLTLTASLDGKAAMSITDQKSSGHALFDREEGWIESSAIEHEIWLQSTVDGNEIPATIRQKTSLERISAEDIVRRPDQDKGR